MGRRLSARLTGTGKRIVRRMGELQLWEHPVALAAAAGVSPSTLYRIMVRQRPARPDEKPRKPQGPQLRTKRRLAKALRMTMADLFGDPQLELPVGDLAGTAVDETFTSLISYQLQNVDSALRDEATRVAAIALADVFLSVAGTSARVDVGQASAMSARERSKLEKCLLSLFGQLPEKVRRQAAKKAMRAVLDLESRRGRKSSRAMYDPIRRANWGDARLLRNRPPLDGTHG